MTFIALTVIKVKSLLA